MNTQVLVACMIFICLASVASSQDKALDAQKATAAVRKYIDDKGAKGGGEITLKSEEAVRQAFPAYQIVNARFRQFPVARILPEGMRASNLFAVDKDGKIEHLKDVKAMQRFFHDNHPVAKTEKDAKGMLAAWLVLTQEFHQDGFFKFEVLVKEFAVAADVGLNARGRLVVMQGGNGDLVAELEYDKEGKLAKVNEKAGIRPGPRPICQATKLLDSDPIVRRIAEQDLLIMGLAAREYLMEQRQLATPDLREAIDRLWNQIQKNGW